MTLGRDESYDFTLTALCVWREARNAGNDARRAVAWVIRNRALNPSWWGKQGWADVILKPYQFSSFNPQDPNANKLPRPDGGRDWTAWLECLALAWEVFHGIGDDPTAGATHYHSREVQPSWTTRLTATAVIGPFAFYRETL